MKHIYHALNDFNNMLGLPDTRLAISIVRDNAIYFRMKYSDHVDPESLHEGWSDENNAGRNYAIAKVQMINMPDGTIGTILNSKSIYANGYILPDYPLWLKFKDTVPKYAAENCTDIPPFDYAKPRQFVYVNTATLLRAYREASHGLLISLRILEWSTRPTQVQAKTKKLPANYNLARIADEADEVRNYANTLTMLSKLLLSRKDLNEHRRAEILKRTKQREVYHV